MPRRRPPDRLDQILEAATRVFGRTGLENSKMSDVATEAGVSQGTLYNYVESKEALFRLLLDRGVGSPKPAASALPLKSPSVGALALRMDEAIAATFALPHLDAALARRRVTDAAAELREVIDELYDRTLSTRQAADVLERSARDVPELAAVFYGKVRRNLFDRLERLFSRRIASGHYHDRDPRVLARFVVEAVTTFARHIYGDVELPAFDLALARPVVIDTIVAGVVVR
ncbi:MAG: TetR/AcrR family transcriptional regulator [Myxococcota bacterium]|nr:TetR/AcrR family transcriptional regulator [Myxococcota bacterium]